MTYKIPFDEKIAKTAILTITLLIDVAKKSENKLTLDQLIHTKKYFEKLYYNDQVELLTTD